MTTGLPRHWLCGYVTGCAGSSRNLIRNDSYDLLLLSSLSALHISQRPDQSPSPFAAPEHELQHTREHVWYRM